MSTLDTTPMPNATGTETQPAPMVEVERIAVLVQNKLAHLTVDQDGDIQGVGPASYAIARALSQPAPVVEDGTARKCEACGGAGALEPSIGCPSCNEIGSVWPDRRSDAERAAELHKSPDFHGSLEDARMAIQAQDEFAMNAASAPEGQNAEVSLRGCTCHPSEAPVPCRKRYALSECLATAPAVPDGRTEEVEKLRAVLERAVASQPSDDTCESWVLDARLTLANSGVPADTAGVA